MSVNAFKVGDVVEVKVAGSWCDYAGKVVRVNGGAGYQAGDKCTYDVNVRENDKQSDSLLMALKGKDAEELRPTTMKFIEYKEKKNCSCENGRWSCMGLPICTFTCFGRCCR